MYFSGASDTICAVALLTIVLIILKLTGIIAWSWVWVVSPIWITLTAVLILM